jgi:antitoxin YefM
MPMKIVTYSELRATLKSVLDQVGEDAEPVIVHRRGQPDVVLLQAADWESMRETLRLLTTPANGIRLLEAIERLDRVEAERVDLAALRAEVEEQLRERASL